MHLSTVFRTLSIGVLDTILEDRHQVVRGKTPPSCRIIPYHRHFGKLDILLDHLELIEIDIVIRCTEIFEESRWIVRCYRQILFGP